MRNHFRAAAVFATLSASLSAHADLIEGDHFSAGDNLAAYDVQSGLTWLDTKVTADMSYNDVLNAINNEASALYNYRLPTLTEVTGLIGSAFSQFTAGFTTEGSQGGAKLAQIESVYNVLGGGPSVPTRYGLYDDGNGVLHFMGTAFFGSQGYAYGENNTNGFTFDDHGGAFGTLLVQGSMDNTAPESETGGNEPSGPSESDPVMDVNAPLTLGALFGLGTLALRRRRRV